MRERWAVVELCAVGGARQPAGTGAAWAGRGPGRAGGGTECAHAGTADGLAGDLQGRCVLCADRSGLPGGLPRADPGRGAGVDRAGARRAGAGRARAVPQSALARASPDAAGAEGTSGRPGVRDGDLRLDRPAQGRDGAVCAAAQLAACRLAAFCVRGRGAGAAEDLDRLCGVGKGVAKRAAGGGGAGDAGGRAGEGQPGVGAGDRAMAGDAAVPSAVAPAGAAGRDARTRRATALAASRGDGGGSVAVGGGRSGAGAPATGAAMEQLWLHGTERRDLPSVGYGGARNVCADRRTDRQHRGIRAGPAAAAGADRGDGRAARTQRGDGARLLEPAGADGLALHRAPV